MNKNIQIIAIIIATILAALLYSALASLVFLFLAKIPFDNFNPLAIWFYIANPSAITDMQSKLFVSLGVPLLAIIFGGSQLYKTNEKNQFGDASWATNSNIKRAELFDKEGVIFGKSNGQYLMSDSPTHALLTAPTRSGKGAGVVIPTLLNWKGSVVCLDIKHENYKITAGYRQHCGQKVFMWAPSDQTGQSHCYNPLDYVSRDPWKQISDLQVLTRILVPDDNKGSSFWENEARAFFVGLAIYVIDNDDMASTIGSINRLMGTEEDLGDVCKHIIKTYKKTLPPAMVKTLMNFANKAAKERSGVKSTLNSALTPWDNPAIDAVTSKSDFDIRDLRKDQISIYVGVTTGQIAALAPLIRIFFEQVITILSSKIPDDDEPHQVLLLMDEFHMLGKMDVMMKAFTLVAGYNTRVMAIIQGLKFLDVTYGRNERDGILSCCAHQIFYTANDLETARYVSESCGDTTIEVISTSQKKSMRYEPPTKNISYRAKPLISKNEVRQLSKKEEVILVEASKPIKCSKIEYWKDKAFTGRVMDAPKIPSLTFKDEHIPKFDIPDPNDSSKDTIDPNQRDFLNEDSMDIDNLMPDVFKEADDSDDLYQPPNKATQ